MDNNTSFWVIFNAIIVILLILDLAVFNRKSHEVKMKEALLWSAFWIFLALVFNYFIYLYYIPPDGGTSTDAAFKFLTGYLVEKSLSVDNLFVFVLVFTYFSVPARYQHKVLFWGILGAIFFRAIFIFAGIALIKEFAFMIYIFGAFLIFTGVKIAFEKDKKLEPEKNPILRLFKRFMKVIPEYHGDKFFVRIKGLLYATPLFVVLIIIETTDVIFAVDSIPAILAITTDPFIVYSSNIFAILGLRALYFALAGLVKLFHFLNYGLAFILIFIGVKMVINHYFGKSVIPVETSLIVILGTLLLSILLSLKFPKKEV
ncbi:MAG TPA: TerC family protein [Ignavibacteria bacterium]|nr:TerC family protein [Ignavibacteria bacterium]